MRALLLVICLSSLSWSLAAATLPNCSPSRACALERAKQLVLQQVAIDPRAAHQQPAVLPPAVELLSALLVLDPREYRNGLTRQVLDRVAATGGSQQLLAKLARQLIARQQDATALRMIVDIEAAVARDPLYQDIAIGHARSRRFELAHWAASRMQPGADRDRVLLTIADHQLQAGLADAAGQTLASIADGAGAPLVSSEDMLKIQAQGAVQRGDARAALELTGRITNPELFIQALSSIAELQIARHARSDALATLRFQRDELRRRGIARAATVALAEGFSLLGAGPEALELVQGSAAERARTLAAIATGAARDQRFDEALRTLERIPDEQRRAVRRAAGFVAQQRAVHGVDFATAFEAANAFSPLSTLERCRLVRDTTLQLAAMGNLPRARDALTYEVEITLQEPECSADCSPSVAPRQSNNACGTGFREESLCGIAMLQARFGFIEDADRTATLLRSEQALLSALLAVAEAQIIAGRTALVRRTFARCLTLARREPNTDRLNAVIKAYAAWVATAPLHYDALADLDNATRELLRIDSNAACLPDKAPLAVVIAHASAGRFAAAFALADTQLQCQQVTAYLRIYERGKRDANDN